MYISSFDVIINSPIYLRGISAGYMNDTLNYDYSTVHILHPLSSIT